MKENALKELYIDELRDIYNAENPHEGFAQVGQGGNV